MRGLKLHEYQAGALLHQNGVQIPVGSVAFSVDEAHQVAGKMSGGCVIKSQILGGGRGMGHIKETGFQGGVKLVNNAEEAKKIATEYLGNHLITKQAPDGLPVNAVYLVEKINIVKELYLSMTLDRAAGCPTFIFSPEGGMSIEDVAESNPEKIFKLQARHGEDLSDADLRQAAKDLGIEEQADQVVDLFRKLLKVFQEKDCDMIEINPLVLTKEGKVLCADSKVTVDSNAAFRQKDLFAQEDKTQDNAKEAHAKKFDLNYIHIGGSIGCLVNGAGLAMSTMDIITQYGATPANFLDVGGSAEGEALAEALKLLNDDEEVKAIFVNIFGGILRCDKLAESIIECNNKYGFNKPMVLRLKGTNSDIAKKLIAGKEKELGIFYNEDFDSAAQQVCGIVKK
jgi:succinyl-CoA synthetase beta subunit